MKRRGTVSYTHLDVYKRQVVIRKSDGETKKALSGVKFELREKISEINEESDAEEEDLSEEKTTYITDENGEIHLSYLRPGVYCLYESEPCLLYTSRCV